MPFARGDMRDHIVSHKNDHGVSYRRYAVLQWWSRLKIGFCEILGVVQFSTFATLSKVQRTCRASRDTSEFDPKADMPVFPRSGQHAGTGIRRIIDIA
jgi:hypothetical protein